MYLIQTVQTTWRPQLPLPRELQLTNDRNSADDRDSKVITTTTTTADIHHHNQDHQEEEEEEDMDRLRGNHSIGGSSQQLSGKQKWSFGRLFRKKKDAESASSSEEDRKAGFVPAQRQSAGKPKGKHVKNSRGSSKFDHVVVSPRQEQAPPHPPQPQIDNEFFLPLENIQPEPYYQNQPGYYQRSSNSLDRRLLLQQPPGVQGNGYQQQHKSRSGQRGPKPPGAHSSEEELISLNSSTFSKYRSDESIHLGSAAGQSRRSRAARNERYYKRLSRDGEPSHGGAPVVPQQHQQQRYKTQPLPLSIYQPTNTSNSYVQWQPQPQKNLQNAMQSDGKRSISYDSHIHLQNLNGRMQSKPLPPPPPPRDPLRRVHVGGGSGQQIGSSSGDLRPVSYAFDHNSRCASDDRIWQPPHYQSVHSLNSQPSSSIVSAPVSQQQPHHRRFITRSERNANPGKQSLPNGIDFHYVADATPRSRKPIHMMDAGRMDSGGAPPSSGVLRTSKSGLPTPNPAPQQPLTKPRSFSSSRLSELRTYPMPMYSEVQKPKRSAPPANPSPNQDNIVCGSLHIKPTQDRGNQNYVEIRHRDVHKTNSMPHHYQSRRSGEDLPNKYEEYVAEKREQHQQAPAPVYPERKMSSTPAVEPPPPVYFPRKKPANLEEAINELEAIYKSLGLTEPAEPKPQPKLDISSKMRVPTPSDFEKFALAHADDYEDEDSPTGEPDPVRDDVAFRNLQLANLQHRSSEKQPPFGIPVGPIVPAPQSDYLHVEPVRVKKKTGSPDIIKDDLAVRSLRKDPPGPKSSFIYPMQKKQRATRTQSANIYNLIHRDAAKPSGGDLNSYMELTRNLERAGSMSNLQGDNDTNDVPATLDLLRKLKAQDEELDLARKHHPIPFRHPSQGGAIAQLPERLTKEEAPRTAPVPAPRKSLTPEPMMDDALNKIAQDAQASSIKLSQELHELRKEALITAARPKLNPEQQRLEDELQQIEAVSEAAKRCGQMLLETLPDAGQEDQESQEKPLRKLHKEGKLIRAIDEVSEAANAVCEKILKDIVTTEPPVVVHEALQVKQTIKTGAGGEQLVMPHLIKKLDPIQSDKIEHIARRCMRQLSELANNPDYDNLATTCNMSNSTTKTTAGDATLVCPVPETQTQGQVQAKPSQTLEEIDKIMQECERQAKSSSSTNTTDDQRTTAPSLTSGSGSGSSFPPNVSTTASSFSSSSDCLAKSSSPSRASRPLSSSITSFNPYSSSDYIKSQSSDCHAPSTDPIKTFSTTSYEGQSTPQSTTISTNTMSTSQSNTISSTTNPSVESKPTTSSGSPPPLQLTPVGERRRRGASCSSSTSSPSQYNSSEELAAIFGIEEQPKQQHHRSRLTGNGDDPTTAIEAPSSPDSDSANANATANATTTNPAQLDPANSATNPVLNAQLDVTTSISTSTSTTHPTSNDNASTCSSHSYKLETIPEHDHDEELVESTLKLSPNFNRIYASKIRIVMDRDEEASLLPEGGAHAALTQFDSLSSLEETSSNPDSGNVSLTDYPLASHANASLELQTIYNSRFQVREHYVSEVSISASESTDEEQTDTECSGRGDRMGAEDFPPLPTEEELEESLREEIELNEGVSAGIKRESSEETEYTMEEISLTKDELVCEVEELKLNEAVSLSQEVYNVTTETLQRPTLDEVDGLRFAIIEVNDSLLNESALDELHFKLDESELDESEIIDRMLEASFDELDELELKESELDESKHDQPILNQSQFNETYNELDSIDLDATELNATGLNEISYDQLDELELDESDSVMPFTRRKSIVYETPQLNLSISELKVNYETQVEQEIKSEPLDEAIKSIDNDDDDTKKGQGGSKANADGSEGNVTETQTHRRKGLPANPANDGEQPTTSCKALSVFGEVRTVAPLLPLLPPQAAQAQAAAAAVGGGATRGGWTTLEHVFVACTVGLITPNDLLTLCLIVIGVIIIIAIALT